MIKSSDWPINRSQRLLEIASDTAIWYHSGLPLVPLRWVLIRDPLGEFRPRALSCTDPGAAPTQIIQWFVPRWQLEVTPDRVGVRAHLGVETQRQWSDRAIARATPVLLGLFSWVTLAAHLPGARETSRCAGPRGMPNPGPPSLTP